MREARRLGFVKPGEQLFIVRGIAALARRADARRHVRSSGRWTTSPSSSGPARAAAARLPAGRRALPLRRARRGRAGAVRPNGTPFPTQFWLTCRHLAPRSRGSRRRAASSAGRGRPPPTRSSRASLERGARRAAGAPARAARAGSAARPGPGASSACTPTPPSRSPGRATSSATGSSPRRSRSGRRTAAARLDDRRRSWISSSRATSGRRAVARSSEPGSATPTALARLAAGRSRSCCRAHPSASGRSSRWPSSPRPTTDADRWTLEVIDDAAGRAVPASVAAATPPSTSTRVAPPTTRRERRAATPLAPPPAPRAPPARALLLVAFVFLGGIGLGEALHDNPSPGGPRPCSGRSRPRARSRA